MLNHVRLCDPMDCNPPGSSVHGILQVRILEWVAISFFIGIGIQVQRMNQALLSGSLFCENVPRALAVVQRTKPGWQERDCLKATQSICLRA